MRDTYPCQSCSKRCPACQDTCAALQLYLNRRQTLKEQIRAEKMKEKRAEEFKSERIEKAKRRAR